MDAARFGRLQSILDGLLCDANATCVLLIDGRGRLLGASGDTQEIGAAAISALTEAAYETVDRQGEMAISGPTHDINVYVIDERVVLIVAFGKNTSLGLVRLRVKKAREELSSVLARKPDGPRGPSGIGGAGDDEGGSGAPAEVGLERTRH